MVVPYDDLDPGIRRVVRWLNDNGFVTVDSGDGRSKFTEEGKPLPDWETDQDFEMVIPHPHVVMEVAPEALVGEADRLRDLLVGASIPVDQQGPDGSPAIQGTYDPCCDHPAFIMLLGVEDTHLA